MIKRISELNNDELKKVFQKNEQLQNEVKEYLIDVEMEYVSENLNSFKKYLKDWDIGFYNQNHIQVKEGFESQFIEGVFDARNDYGFLSDEEFEKWQSIDFWVFDEENGENELNESLFNEFVQVVLNRLNEMTDIYNYDIEDYFINNYVNCYMYYYDEDYYIDYNTFELFQVITKSYK